MNLIKEVSNLKNTEISKVVNQRLKEFNELNKKGNDEWFSELCFCILTSNSRASSAMRIQDQLGINGFLHSPEKNISDAIRMNRHRFHNNKAKFIVNARQHRNIKDILKDKSEMECRDWLVENVKGIGMKESSHFLRNVGKKNLAILDRHILNLFVENQYLDERPKTITKKNYEKIEGVFQRLSERLEMSPAELDLYMWYMKTGVVLK